MKFEQYTEKLKLAIQQAQSIAIENQNQFITQLHLYVAIQADEDNLISQILLSASGNVDLINQDIFKELEKLPKISGSNIQPSLSNDAIRVLTLAEKIAEKRKDKYITLEIVLFALFPKTSKSSIMRLFHHPFEQRLLGRTDNKVFEVERLKVGDILGLALGMEDLPYFLHFFRGLRWCKPPGNITKHRKFHNLSHLFHR